MNKSSANTERMENYNYATINVKLIHIVITYDANNNA